MRTLRRGCTDGKWFNISGLMEVLTSNRLEPYVYHIVRLSGDNKARAFLEGVGERSRALYVVKLIIGMEVSIPSMVKVLTICQNVEELAIKPCLRYVTRRSINPLLGPMENLLQMKTIYTEVVTVPGEEHVPLPDFTWFNRLSRLHLNVSWASLESVPDSISTLQNLTHLSMFWITSRHCTSELKKFLEKGTTVVLIIWINDWVMESAIQKDLHLRGLKGNRVVLFRSSLMCEYMAAGGFWMSAEKVVKWRVDNNGMCHSC
jgi:hypothetical protein